MSEAEAADIDKITRRHNSAEPSIIFDTEENVLLLQSFYAGFVEIGEGSEEKDIKVDKTVTDGVVKSQQIVRMEFFPEYYPIARHALAGSLDALVKMRCLSENDVKLILQHPYFEEKSAPRPK